MSETQIRCPRMHGFPKQISGLMLIRSSNSARLMHISCNFSLDFGAERGTRTPTPFSRLRILSPLRLPIPPSRPLSFILCYACEYPEKTYENHFFLRILLKRRGSWMLSSKKAWPHCERNLSLFKRRGARFIRELLSKRPLRFPSDKSYVYLKTRSSGSMNL
jgi:hypothetical protein